MGFGMEIAAITRQQDFTSIKHNEDNKSVLNRAQLEIKVEKENEQKARDVNTADNADLNNQRPDGREKGKNEYTGDGGEKRKQNSKVEKVLVKGHGGFDIKI